MGSTGWPKALCGAFGPYIGSRGAEQPPPSTRGAATITAIQADLCAICAPPDSVHGAPRTIARQGASHCELVHKISRTVSPAVIEITAVSSVDRRQHLPLRAGDNREVWRSRLRISHAPAKACQDRMSACGTLPTQLSTRLKSDDRKQAS